MNLRYVLRQLGLLMWVLSACMALAATWELWLLLGPGGFEPRASWALLISVGVGVALGGGLWLAGGKGAIDAMTRRGALLLVGLSWLLGAGLAALPFLIWAWLREPDLAGHPFRNPIACYFEAMSGLTTTGSTVLLSRKPFDIESLPQGLLLWRATTHWLGGVGIVVLFVAVLPMIGVGGKRLFQVEAPGPKQQGVRPRIRETARILWAIYLGLTITQTALLMLAGLSFFDALCHTFATLATGGFSTRNASAGAFGLLVQTILIVFMLLAGVNFGIYYSLIRRRFRETWRDLELRVYLGSVLLATAIITGVLIGQTLHLSGDPAHPETGEVLPSITSASFPIALLHAAFQVVSIHTTTGFATADFDRWPFIAKAVLVLIMFIGGCAGSTGGGIKVIRIVVAAKVMLAEVERTFRPHVVRTIRVGNSTVDADMRQSVLVFVLGMILIWVVGGLAVMVLENGFGGVVEGGGVDFISASTASLACLMNIGPGLGLVGAVQNYGFFSTPSLAILSLLMVLGRLEVYAVLVLILPGAGFWRMD